jgi:hypothetical protein
MAKHLSYGRAFDFIELCPMWPPYVYDVLL